MVPSFCVIKKGQWTYLLPDGGFTEDMSLARMDYQIAAERFSAAFKDDPELKIMLVRVLNWEETDMTGAFMALGE